MEKMFCSNCGGEIFVDFVVPPRSFSINDSGEIYRVDNREYEYAGFEVYCSNDTECKFYPVKLEEQKEFDSWLEKIKENIIKSSKLIQMILVFQRTLEEE
jgi:hypothetical protein